MINCGVKKPFYDRFDLLFFLSATVLSLCVCLVTFSLAPQIEDSLEKKLHSVAREIAVNNRVPCDFRCPTNRLCWFVGMECRTGHCQTLEIAGVVCCLRETLPAARRQLAKPRLPTLPATFAVQINPSLEKSLFLLWSRALLRSMDVLLRRNWPFIGFIAPSSS